MKKKWVKYVLRTAIGLIVVWILFVGAAFLYVKANKQKLISTIKENLTKKISGEVDFTELTVDFFHNFPNISIDLENVRLQDTLYHVHKTRLLEVQDLYIGFGFLNLFSKNRSPKYLTLSNGTIHFLADSTGVKNWKILKKQEGKKKSLELEKVIFNNIDVIFEDRPKYKYYDVWFQKMKCVIHSGDKTINLEMENNAMLKTIAFNTRVGSYLANKRLTSQWDIAYDRDLKKISLKNQRVRINKQAYQLTSDFFVSEEPHFDLSVTTLNLSIAEAGSIFPQKTEQKIAKFSLSKPLAKVEVHLSGPMKYLSFPVAIINFSVSDASLGIPPVNFDHCSFNGSFKNNVDPAKPFDDRNSLLQFTAVKGEWEKNTFAGRDISIYNLIEPFLKCDVDFVFRLDRLEKAIASNRLDFNGGEGEATINYAGPLLKKDTLYELKGKVTVRNGDISYNPRNLNFKNTELELVFEKGDMQVKKMNTEVNNNNIRINGKINDFMGFFNTDSAKAAFEWSVYSPRLDIGKLRSSLRRNASVKKKSGYSFFEKLNSKIDKLFDDCNAYLVVQADKLIYKNFSATNVKGKLALTNDIIRLDNFSLEHAGGGITVNASSKDNGNTSDLVLQSKMQNVNIRELFSSFNNFGMESLTSKNISGSFSADINLTSMLDADNNLIKSANQGFIDFSMKNGRLENYKPLMDIDNNFLQKRNLSDVSFAELKDRLDLKGNDIYMHRMEIRSTAVSMYLEGIYSFANNTDISIQVPLHGQKKDQDETPQNKGVKAKTGISVFLRAKDDKDGKLKISYDLLGRFRSKK